jgi:hypothetical protein
LFALSKGATSMTKDLSGGQNRKNLKKSSFALPEQEKYPIPDPGAGAGPGRECDRGD